jgi:predicted anti-sigma-YlaC factor YlaD
MHLRHCPRCRERQEQLAAVSHLLAGVLREKDLVPGPVMAARSAAPHPPVRIRRPLLVSLVLLMAVLSLMAFIQAVRSRVTDGGAAPRIRQMKAPGDGCRPDLSNDRCR